MQSYLIRVGDALSQLANVVLFDGHPNESMSGRAHRTGSKWEHVINALLFWDKEHCKNSHQNDIDYAKKILGINK